MVTLCIAVVGGLIFSQFLTLFITPAFYVSMERLHSRYQTFRGRHGSVLGKH